MNSAGSWVTRVYTVSIEREVFEWTYPVALPPVVTDPLILVHYQTRYTERLESRSCIQTSLTCTLLEKFSRYGKYIPAPTISVVGSSFEN